MALLLVFWLLQSYASIFLFSSNKTNKESSPASSITSTKESTSKTSTSQGKTDETDKDKQEKIQKLKDQLTDLDTKITEAEALVSKLKGRNCSSETGY